MRPRWIGLAVGLSLVAAACTGSSVGSGASGWLNEGSVSEASDVPVTSVTSPTANPAKVSTTTDPNLETVELVDPDQSSRVVTGAEVLASRDFAEFNGMRVGLIVNQTSMVGENHLIDLVERSSAVELAAIFAPEHGVRGIADAGELVEDAVDTQTGTPILSLYGATKQPTLEMFRGIDVVFYDLQDVGVRHYTFISTMGLAMQTVAAAGIPFVVLDRPNPLGGKRIAGPVLEAELTSFIGQYPIPSIYGLTVGELALAIKGEGWLDGLEDLDLVVVGMQDWSRSMIWSDTGLDWIAPSPGLPRFESALVYPGTVLIEATTISYGNGTLEPFTRVGAPWLDGQRLSKELNARELPGVRFEWVGFRPTVIENMAPNPRLEGQDLEGISIEVIDQANYEPFRTGLELFLAIEAQAKQLGVGSIIDRGQVFDLLTGSTRLRSQLVEAVEAEALIEELGGELSAFDQVRQRYFLYPG